MEVEVGFLPQLPLPCSTQELFSETTPGAIVEEAEDVRLEPSSQPPPKSEELSSSQQTSEDEDEEDEEEKAYNELIRAQVRAVVLRVGLPALTPATFTRALKTAFKVDLLQTPKRGFVNRVLDQTLSELAASDPQRLLHLHAHPLPSKPNGASKCRRDVESSGAEEKEDTAWSQQVLEAGVEEVPRSPPPPPSTHNKKKKEKVKEKTKRKRTHKLSAYNAFVRQVGDAHKAAHPEGHSLPLPQLLKSAAEAWRALPESQRQEFKSQWEGEHKEKQPKSQDSVGESQKHRHKHKHHHHRKHSHHSHHSQHHHKKHKKSSSSSQELPPNEAATATSTTISTTTTTTATTEPHIPRRVTVDDDDDE